MLEISDLGSRGIVLCSENKGADQVRAADLRLCFAYAKSSFSHDAAPIDVAVATIIAGSF